MSEQVWTATVGEPPVVETWTYRDDADAVVFLWLCRNPGRDAEDVARAIGIPDLQAIEIVGRLLEEGLLDFSE